METSSPLDRAPIEETGFHCSYKLRERRFHFVANRTIMLPPSRTSHPHAAATYCADGTTCSSLKKMGMEPSTLTVRLHLPTKRGFAPLQHFPW